MSRNLRLIAGGLSLAFLSLMHGGCVEKTEVAQEPEEAEASKSTSDPDEAELEYWRSVKESEHTEDLWAYLERYPDGTFSDLAKQRIERLAKGEEPKSSAPPVATRQSRAEVVRSVIKKELARFSDPRLHLAPNIPRLKLDNAAHIHGFDTSRVLLLWDDGLSGGGKTGFCLTDRKIYWRFVSGSPAYYLDYEDIDHVRVRKKKLQLNGYDLGVTMASDPRHAAEVFGELIEAIRDAMERR